MNLIISHKLISPENKQASFSDEQTNMPHKTMHYIPKNNQICCSTLMIIIWINFTLDSCYVILHKKPRIRKMRPQSSSSALRKSNSIIFGPTFLISCPGAFLWSVFNFLASGSWFGLDLEINIVSWKAKRETKFIIQK